MLVNEDYRSNPRAAKFRWAFSFSKGNMWSQGVLRVELSAEEPARTSRCYYPNALDGSKDVEPERVRCSDTALEGANEFEQIGWMMP